MFTYDLWADTPHTSSCFLPSNGSASQLTAFSNWICELVFHKEYSTYSLPCRKQSILKKVRAVLKWPVKKQCSWAAFLLSWSCSWILTFFFFGWLIGCLRTLLLWNHAVFLCWLPSTEKYRKKARPVALHYPNYLSGHQWHITRNPRWRMSN